ncbi:hypothetical protein [Sandaracinus amylolyticus]|uniref:hypothetical protein n=1 Tax=Sandaracinus amylolyticus TaxID=927083 RepID=UPI001F3C0C16|nr:hypothetical protein [Sandaracinus amylolyticus]UJR85832.1 Hypothetical protein I5071_79120 [Sandaracinus amylolyticus]
MTDTLYWSETYTDQYVEALRRDADFQKAARKFEGSMTFRCLDTPEGTDVEATYVIDKGAVSVTRRAEKAPSSALRAAPIEKSVFARTTAPYALWCKLDRGEMNVLQAVASPDYQVEGSKLKIMANIGVLNAMSAVASRVPKRY